MHFISQKKCKTLRQNYDAPKKQSVQNYDKKAETPCIFWHSQTTVKRR